MSRQIIVFDLETNSTNPNTCDVFQIGAVIVDPVRCEIVDGSEFMSWSKPDNLDDPNYYDLNKQTIDWHCNNYGWSKDKFMSKLEESPPESVVWNNFVEYVKKYHTRPTNQSIHSAPSPAGYNIIEYDMIIIDRLCQKYGNIDKDKRPALFYRRDIRDILHIVSLWLSPLREVKSFSLDNIRNYMGMSKTGAHDALVDVKQEAELLIKFLKLHQHFAEKISFKNSFSN